MSALLLLLFLVVLCVTLWAQRRLIKAQRGLIKAQRESLAASDGLIEALREGVRLSEQEALLWGSIAQWRFK